MAPAAKRLKRKAILLLQTPSGKNVLWHEMLRHQPLETLAQDPVVVVAVGSVQQRGSHCPLDVNFSLPYHLAVRAAESVTEFPVVVAPGITFGFTRHSMGEIGTITLSLEMLVDILCDVSLPICANRFHRLILLNGHGGNEQPPWAATVKLAQEDIWPVALAYWNMAHEEFKAWSDPDKALDIEESGKPVSNLYMRPAVVDISWEGKDNWRPKFSDEVGRCARFPERRREMAHRVMGNPFVASVEKGERLFSVLLERLTALRREFHEIEPPRYREFGSHCS